MTIEAITFDFWSTLYKGQSVDYTQRLFKLKEMVERNSNLTFEPERFKAAVNVAGDIWSQTWIEQYRTIGAAEWLGIILKELEVTLPAYTRQEIQTSLENRLLDEIPTLVPEAKTVLAKLAARYHLAIISDTGVTPGRVLRQILEMDGIIDYFTYLTFSDEIGRSKPHPEPFLSTLKHLGTEPTQAAHIGDLLRTDIAGAKGVNMRAVQYVGINRDNDISAKETTIWPDAIITDHAELLPLLEIWRNEGTASNKLD